MLISVSASIWVTLAFLDLYRKDENWYKIKYKKTAGKFFLTVVVLYIFIFLWTLLLIIPGIVKSFAYCQTLFILKDNPEMSIWDAITKSQKMMKGHKWEFFWLTLTFIGWILLSIITLGIGFIYLMPYMQTTIAAYYEDLKNENVANAS